MGYVTDEQGKKLVTLIRGDGVGPEVVRSARRILEAAGAPIAWDEQAAGAEVFRQGIPSGIPEETVASIRRTGVALKGPLETPVGYGEKSANVTLRKMFELYANVRPARELPGVPTPFGGHKVDLVVVRENVEDLYAGIEHMQSPGVAQSLKLITRKGCEKIVRLAFEVARTEQRTRIHCATKANILKQTEGMLKRTFEDIAPEYPDIRAEHIIIDNCAHQLVRFPEHFSVIVTTNMNGDILSDLTSGLAGGLGFAPSANYGHDAVMFEAVHGSAPNIAGKNVVNPTAVILSAVMLLRHLEEFEIADVVKHALLVTLEDGRNLTMDVVGDEEPATTTVFTDTIIENLGRKSRRYSIRPHSAMNLPERDPDPVRLTPKSRRVVGIDLFLEEATDPDTLGRALDERVEGAPLKLKMISNRGMQVYPTRGGQTDIVDHWRCRFVLRDGAAEMTDADVLDLLQRVGPSHRWNHIEKLQEFDGHAAYTRAQGED